MHLQGNGTCFTYSRKSQKFQAKCWWMAYFIYWHWIMCTEWHTHYVTSPTAPTNHWQLDQRRKRLDKLVQNLCPTIIHGSYSAVQPRCSKTVFKMASQDMFFWESVDSLCRDGADAQYMQYLSKSHTYNLTTNTLKAYLSAQASPLSAFVISNTRISGQSLTRQLNAKVCDSKSAIFRILFSDNFSSNDNSNG